jgi:hypothetical protein
MLLLLRDSVSGALSCFLLERFLSHFQYPSTHTLNNRGFSLVMGSFLYGVA